LWLLSSFILLPSALPRIPRRLIVRVLLVEPPQQINWPLDVGRRSGLTPYDGCDKRAYASSAARFSSLDSWR
jgi:hypothetical protein